MSNSNSQEQTIYRSLAGQIQLRFFEGGEHFPSAQEIARRYQVSYCPAQRALKALEKEGLVKLCRGKETVILNKPYDNFLESSVFRERSAALSDLNKSLMLLSPAVSMQGISHMGNDDIDDILSDLQHPVHQGKRLYRTFERCLLALGSRTAMSLYYDIGSFIESAYLDIVQELHGAKAEDFLRAISDQTLQCIQEIQNNRPFSADPLLTSLSVQFFDEIEQYFNALPLPNDELYQKDFSWIPHKGRPRYCDVIAIDMVCKINHGSYPVDSFLPNTEVLADIYHVSAITIRRTVNLLNKLGVTRTFNGIGTKVISSNDSSILYKLKELMLDSSLRTCLEAIQLLAITCENVITYSYEYFSEDFLNAIGTGLAENDRGLAITAVISSCLQAIVHCCPLKSICEIYEKITLLLLEGSILRLDHPGHTSAISWGELSSGLLNGIKTGNSAVFARNFRKLILENFSVIKRDLIKIGINGADEIADPIFFDVD